jgi:branched-chain amino acid transport system permease protein
MADLSSTLMAQTLLSGALLGLIYTLMAVGLSLTMGVLGLVNVAHSTYVMLGSFLALELLQRFGLDPLLGVAVALVVFFLGGVLVDRVVIRRLVDPADAVAVLALFGLLVVIESAATLVWTTDTRVLRVSYGGASVAVGPLALVPVRLVAAALALALVLALDLLLRGTLLGKAMRAVGQNRDAAVVLGIDVQWVSTLVVALGTALGAVGGVALAMVFPFAPQDHIRWLAWAFLVVVVGGLGSVRRTLLAGLVVGVVEALSGVLLPFQYVYLVVYGLLALALMVRSQGLAGARARTI